MCIKFQDHSPGRAFLKNLLHKVLPRYILFFGVIESNPITKQRVIMKFLVKFGKTNAVNHATLLAVYGAAMIKHSAMYEWI